MASLDLKVEQNCIEEFIEMKMKNKYRFIVYKLTDGYKKIEIEHTLQRLGEDGSEEDFENLRPLLPEGDCRYIAYKVEYKMKSSPGMVEGKREKIVFISWSPLKASVKSRLMYSCAKSNFKKKLMGIPIDVQMGPSDCEYGSLLEKCMQFTR